MHYLNVDFDKQELMDITKFLKKEHDNYSLLGCAITAYLSKLKPYETYTITKYEKRPDWYSYEKYQSFEYWWIICLYNNIVSFNELTLGRQLNLLSKSQMDDMLIQFGFKEKETN